MYTYADIKTALNKYVADRKLVNAHDQSYINVGEDELLQTTLSGKSDSAGSSEFLKREHVIERLSEKMQNWYEVRAEGHDPVLKYGPLSSCMSVANI